MSRNDLHWFDAHLDLATLAVEGRDLRVSVEEATGEPQPASVTLPSLRAGQVVGSLATIFTAPEEPGPCGYPSSEDLDAAHQAGRIQLEVYEEWERAGLVRRVEAGVDFEFSPGREPLAIAILMEGADPIRRPDEASWWVDRGVRVVGLSWGRGTRYAGGNARPGGLTMLGRALVDELDELGVIHDLSHLPDGAAWELLEHTRGPVIASHSNCRALVDGQNQRHLPDELIQAIGDRGGVVGLNLFSAFLTPDGTQRRATIEETTDHVVRIAELTGRRSAVGLGSDMDGGFGADRMPQGIDQPSDLMRLLDDLKRRGWSDREVDGFAWVNWAGFFARRLPRRPVKRPTTH
ncbi:MAG: dipeptidase [Phycisphaerales bacterium]